MEYQEGDEKATWWINNSGIGIFLKNENQKIRRTGS